MKTRLKDLLIKTNFAKVWKVLKKIYTKSHKASYMLTWIELLSFKRIPSNKDNMRINIYTTYESDEKKTYYYVDGINDDKTVPGWALDFSTFREWLSYYIPEKLSKEYTVEEIWSRCLWEMTFIGYSNKNIVKVKKHLQGLLKDCKENKNIKPIDKVFDKEWDNLLKDVKDD